MVMLGLLAFGTMLALYAAIAFVIFGIAWVGITEGVGKALERRKSNQRELRMIEIFYKHRMEGPAMFELGMLVATTRIADRIREDREFNHFVFDSLERYKNCDWGDLDEEDKMMNDEAVKNGEDRIFAAYKNSEKDWKIWIITEADRKTTTILFPEEY